MADINAKYSSKIYNQRKISDEYLHSSEIIEFFWFLGSAVFFCIGVVKIFIWKRKNVYIK